MKTLYIVRHGKSSWEFNVPDDERPLIKKGIKRTHKIADFLIEKETKADLFISSHANRALSTAKIIAGVLDYAEEDIQVTSNLYLSSPDRIYDELFALDDKIDNVMIFGHNPTFTDFANHFLEQMIDWLPTSATVAIRFHTDKWSDISLAKHETLFIVFPRDL